MALRPTAQSSLCMADSPLNHQNSSWHKPSELPLYSWDHPDPLLGLSGPAPSSSLDPFATSTPQALPSSHLSLTALLEAHTGHFHFRAFNLIFLLPGTLCPDIPLAYSFPSFRFSRSDHLLQRFPGLPSLRTFPPWTCLVLFPFLVCFALINIYIILYILLIYFAHYLFHIL